MSAPQVVNAEAAPDPVDVAHRRVTEARQALADLDVEAAAIKERLAKIADADSVSPDDLAFEASATRRAPHRKAAREAAVLAVDAALAQEREAVQQSDGVAVVFGSLLGPGDVEQRSSMILSTLTTRTAGPAPLPAGSRVRILVPLGIQAVVPQAPTAGPLEFLDIRPGHSVLRARIRERPSTIGHMGSETVLLHVGGPTAGIGAEMPSSLSGSRVKEMHILGNLVGLLVKTDRSQLVIPAWNVAWLELDSGNLPGLHFLSVGGWDSVQMRIGVNFVERARAVTSWKPGPQRLAPLRVNWLELREGAHLVLRDGEHVNVFDGGAVADNGMQAQIFGSIGVVLRQADCMQWVTWNRIRAVAVSSPE